jgi:FtsZ-binding cell division protein ZapB
MERSQGGQAERMSEPINYGKHWSEVLKELNAENANLKAEVERLKEGNDCLGQMHDKEMERSAYLCEEVNRTTAWGRGLESDLSHARVEISFLKAEVERLKEDNRQLTKAFEIAEGIIKRMGKAAEDAAKEGKQP